MTIEQELEKNNFHFYKNRKHPKPKHKASGKHRTFYKMSDKTLVLPNGDEAEVKYKSSGIMGCDIYCANCDHWNTMKGESILFSIAGNCKNCNHSFLD